MRAKGSKQVVIMSEYDRCYIFLKSIEASDKSFVLHVTNALLELETTKVGNFENMAVSLI